MAGLDLHNDMRAVLALAPVAAVTDNTAFVSAILDTAGFNANELVLIAGSIADADVTFTILIEESDAANMSGNAAVADADLLGVEAGMLLFSSDNKTSKIGYIGSKRYIRATITPAANSGNIFLSGVWIQAFGRSPAYETQIN